MRSEAGRLLFDPAGGKRQKFRVCHCGRSLKGTELAVFRSPDGSRARFQGAIMCGSAWECPICAYRIGAIRQQELEKANVAWSKSGGVTHLITLTFPHEADWPLADMLARFDKARNRWKNSRTYKKILGKEGAVKCIGAVSSLEVTHGVSGWHPHLHMLAMTARELHRNEIDDLIKEWVKKLFAVGLGENSKLTAMMNHALDCRGGADAAAYICKYGREESWGLSREMTGNVAKEASEGGRKPFGLLLDSIEGDEHAGHLFREFAEAFHGKRLMTWSPGLKARFSLGEDDDDAAANAPESEASEYVGALNVEQWRVILSRNAVAELENYAAVYCIDPEKGQADLDEFVAWVETRLSKSGGWFYTPMQRQYR